MRRAISVQSLGVRVLVSAAVVLMTVGTAWAGFGGTDVFVASVGRGAGQGGSEWRTTLWIHNPTGSAAHCQLMLLFRNQANYTPPTYNVTVQPGDTVKYEDAIWTLFGIEAYGALRVVSDHDVVVNSRIYNQPGSEVSDTQGQFFAAMPADFAIGAGESTDVLGVNQATDDDFRFNYGFVEVTGNTTTIRVTLYDGDGTVLGAHDYTLQPSEPMQVGLSDLGAGSTPTGNGRLHVEVIGGFGKIIAFGSGIANDSQDPSTFEMTMDLPSSSGTGLTEVAHDSTLIGDGTSTDPLGLADGAVTSSKIALDTVVRSLSGVRGDVDLVAGSGVTITPDTSGHQVTIDASEGLTLPYSGNVSAGSTAGFMVRDSGDLAALYAYALGTGSGLIARSGSNAAMYGQCSEPNCKGAWGTSTATTGSGMGVYGSCSGANCSGVKALASPTTGSTYGVYGENRSSNGAGVYGTSPVKGVGGVASNTSGTTYGVWGRADSPDGFAVYGYNSDGHGVYGYTGGDWNWFSGVYGLAWQDHANGVTGWNTGAGTGVYAVSQSGTAIIAKGGGSVLLGVYDYGTDNRRFRVDQTGEVYADGSFHSGGADFAELYEASESLEPGTVVAIGDDGRLVKASSLRPTAVMGVVPQKSTIVGNSPDEPAAREGMVPVAILGIVDVQASTASGAIRPGDLLCAGSVPGTAEKAVWATPGTVIGKALEPLSSDRGTIRMLVTLR